MVSTSMSILRKSASHAYKKWLTKPLKRPQETIHQAPKMTNPQAFQNLTPLRRLSTLKAGTTKEHQRDNASTNHEDQGFNPIGSIIAASRGESQKQQSRYSIGSIMAASRVSRTANNLNFFKSDVILSLFWSLLLQQSSDIELNPGSEIRYPCSICERACKWGERAVQCDACDHWYHKDCMLMRSALYDILRENESMIWICGNCGHSNHSISIISDPPNTSNTYSSLSTDDPDLSFPSTRSISDTSFQLEQLRSPMACSSPSKHKHNTDKNKIQGLRVAIANCQNARTKSKLMEAMLDSIQPDVFIATESHLLPENTNNEFLPQPYSEHGFRRDRSPPDGHGGVFIAIRDKFIARHATEYERPDCELTWAELQDQNNHQIFIGSYYRPPRSTEVSISQLDDSISQLKREHKNATIIVGGDFNLPGIDWENLSIRPGAPDRTQCQSLLDIMNLHNLQQINLQPTRGSNILDLCFTSSPGVVDKIQTTPGFSDHDHMVLLDTQIRATINKKKPRTIFQYKKANWTNIQNAINEKSMEFWDTLPASSSTEQNWNNFKHIITSTIEEHIPTKQTSGRYHLPWLTRNTKRLINKMKRVCRKAKASGKSKHWDEFHDLRRQCQRTTTQDYYNYINKLIDPAEDKTKKNLWSYLKHKRQDSFGVSTLKTNGKLHTTPESKAEALNDQFVSVFTQESIDNMPDKGPSPFPHMPDLKITVNGVFHRLKKLDTSKATGPDNISSRFLKECAAQLAPMLSFIYQQSIDTGCVPEDWRNANVVPIFKKLPTMVCN